MKIKEANEITGGLTFTSKMPCPSYDIPAQACKVGSKLAKQKGTVCSTCYALKGRYLFKNVTNAQTRRLNSINHPRWKEAMTFLIDHYCKKSGVFRWFSSGDIQSPKMLKDIQEIAEKLPEIDFWLPTKEYKMVKDYLRLNDIPDNLIIRISSSKIGEKPLELKGIKAVTSTVHRAEAVIDKECPAYKQNHQCGTCRACWDKRVKNVSYLLH